MLISMLLLFRQYATLDIDTILTSTLVNGNAVFNVYGINLDYNLVVALSLSLAASIKSAQFIFHAWLPDSMEAPAPASALIHSATLVSAGIFLLTRLSNI